MKKNRILNLLIGLIVIMTMGIFVGCGPAEKGTVGNTRDEAIKLGLKDVKASKDNDYDIINEGDKSYVVYVNDQGIAIAKLTERDGKWYFLTDTAYGAVGETDTYANYWMNVTLDGKSYTFVYGRNYDKNIDKVTVAGKEAKTVRNGELKMWYSLVEVGDDLDDVVAYDKDGKVIKQNK